MCELNSQDSQKATDVVALYKCVYQQLIVLYVTKNKCKLFLNLCLHYFQMFAARTRLKCLHLHNSMIRDFLCRHFCTPASGLYKSCCVKEKERCDQWKSRGIFQKCTTSLLNMCIALFYEMFQIPGEEQIYIVLINRQW